MLVVPLAVDLPCMQHGRRCVGATIVVSKQGEFHATVTPPVHGTRRTYRLLSPPSGPPPPPPHHLLVLLLFFLPLFLVRAINTQPPSRLCSDSSKLVATDTTEAAGKDRFRADTLSQDARERKRAIGPGIEGERRATMRRPRFVILGEKSGQKERRKKE